MIFATTVNAPMLSEEESLDRLFERLQYDVVGTANGYKMWKDKDGNALFLEFPGGERHAFLAGMAKTNALAAEPQVLLTYRALIHRYGPWKDWSPA